MKKISKKSNYLLVSVSAILLFAAACAPSFPGDETHNGKKSEECFECHSSLKEEHIPKNHLDDAGELLEGRTDCLKCHKNSGKKGENEEEKDDD